MLFLVRCQKSTDDRFFYCPRKAPHQEDEKDPENVRESGITEKGWFNLRSYRE